MADEKGSRLARTIRILSTALVITVYFALAPVGYAVFTLWGALPSRNPARRTRLLQSLGGHVEVRAPELRMGGGAELGHIEVGTVDETRQTGLFEQVAREVEPDRVPPFDQQGEIVFGLAHGRWRR